jgi:osmotically-inducible protein OsmY
MSTHSSLVGLGFFLAIAALFVAAIGFHLGRHALGALGVVGGVFVALLVVWLVWRSTPQRRRGFVGNALLTAPIKADLITQLGANNVNVDSSNGVVTLRGSVPHEDFKDVAEHLAKRRGASEVIDELEVSPSAAWKPDPYMQGFPGVTTPEGAPEVPTRAPLDQKVREALEDDPRVNANVVTVSVEDGIAYLTGRQGTTDASKAATEAAIHVPGISGVSNDMEILPSA